MKIAALLLISIALIGCSSAPEPAAEPAKPVAATGPAKVPDHTSVFDDKDKVSTSIVPDHMLGIPALPGGSFAEYNSKGKKYQEFIIDLDSNQHAAFAMLDIKHAMTGDPEYLAHIGGYFGTWNGQPLYCFAKLHYLAGVVGLPQAKADPLAIWLANQLH
jgi:hypothetical protein